MEMLSHSILALNKPAILPAHQCVTNQEAFQISLLKSIYIHTEPSRLKFFLKRIYIPMSSYLPFLEIGEWGWKFPPSNHKFGLSGTLTDFISINLGVVQRTVYLK